MVAPVELKTLRFALLPSSSVLDDDYVERLFAASIYGQPRINHSVNAELITSKNPSCSHTTIICHLASSHNPDSKPFCFDP